MTLPDFSDEGQNLAADNTPKNWHPSEPAEPTKSDNRDRSQPNDMASSPPTQLMTSATASMQFVWRLLQGLTARLAAQEGNPGRRRLGRYLSVSAGLVAIALLLILGWKNQQLQRSLRLQEQRLAEANAAINELEQEQLALNAVLANFHKPQAAYSLQGMGELANAAGSVVTIADENKALLVMSELPALPDNQVYRFWATTDTKGRLMYCGQFTVDQTAFAEWSLPNPVCSQQATRALVTVDPITASTASEGEIVLKSRSVQAANE